MCISTNLDISLNSKNINSRTSADMPCLNCRLIEMGEMACYQERCPQCGRIPPDRKDQSGKKIKQPVLKKLVGRM